MALKTGEKQLRPIIKNAIRASSSPIGATGKAAGWLSVKIFDTIAQRINEGGFNDKEGLRQFIVSLEPDIQNKSTIQKVLRNLYKLLSYLPERKDYLVRAAGYLRDLQDKHQLNGNGKNLLDEIGEELKAPGLSEDGMKQFDALIKELENLFINNHPAEALEFMSGGRIKAQIRFYEDIISDEVRQRIANYARIVLGVLNAERWQITARKPIAVIFANEYPEEVRRDKAAIKYDTHRRKIYIDINTEGAREKIAEAFRDYADDNGIQAEDIGLLVAPSSDQFESAEAELKSLRENSRSLKLRRRIQEHINPLNIFRKAGSAFRATNGYMLKPLKAIAVFISRAMAFVILTAIIAPIIIVISGVTSAATAYANSYPHSVGPDGQGITNFNRLYTALTATGLDENSAKYLALDTLRRGSDAQEGIPAAEGQMQGRGPDQEKGLTRTADKETGAHPEILDKNYLELLVKTFTDAGLDRARSEELSKKVILARQQADGARRAKVKAQEDIDSKLKNMQSVHEQLRRANEESEKWLEERKLGAGNSWSAAMENDQKVAGLLSYLVKKRLEQEKLFKYIKERVRIPNSDMLSIIADWAKQNRDKAEERLRAAESYLGMLEKTLEREKQKPLPLQEEIRKFAGLIKHQKGRGCKERLERGRRVPDEGQRLEQR
jgi:hypothetical protein